MESIDLLICSRKYSLPLFICNFCNEILDGSEVEADDLNYHVCPYCGKDVTLIV